MFSLLASATALILVILVTILMTILVNGVQGLSFKLIFTAPSTEFFYGARPAIFGTIFLILGAVAISLPLGLFTAIYLNEYAREGPILTIIRQAISNLAAVPSIIFGLFGYAFFVLILNFGKSMLAAWCTLACMMLPTIIRTSEEALKNVPREYREGSMALGITKWRTIRHVVLPAAAPGISTGVILALGRAAGETAAILFVGASSLSAGAFTGFLSRFSALPYQLYLMVVDAPSDTRPIQWAIALILIIIVFGFNIIAIVIRNRSEAKRR
ncbi:MAG: phosphate ABC transporter permease PstA [Candidatus Heimdallarchaeota archaeon]|nr:phosphate ABC transporter permease PstA [Candidatus Heimdallarchaeota archaeon]